MRAVTYYWAQLASENERAMQGVLSLKALASVERALLSGKFLLLVADTWRMVQAVAKQVRLWSGRKARKRKAAGLSTAEFEIDKMEIKRGELIAFVFKGRGRLKFLVPDFNQPAQSTETVTPADDLVPDAE